MNEQFIFVLPIKAYIKLNIFSNNNKSKVYVRDSEIVNYISSKYDIFNTNKDSITEFKRDYVYFQNISGFLIVNYKGYMEIHIKLSLDECLYILNKKYNKVEYGKSYDF
jgi:hypothetical protein